MSYSSSSSSFTGVPMSPQNCTSGENLNAEMISDTYCSITAELIQEHEEIMSELETLFNVILKKNKNKI